MKRTSIILLLIVMLLSLCVSCATFDFSSLFHRGKQNEELESVEVASEEIKEDVKNVFADVKETVITVKEDVVKTTQDAIKEVKETLLKNEKAEYSYKYVYNYAGIEIAAEAHNGYGYVSYPSYITEQEINDAAVAFVKAHGNLGITYKITAPGKLYVTYPVGLTIDDLNYAAAMVKSDLDWYINKIFEAAKTVEEPIVEQPVVIEQPAIVETPKAEPVVVVETTQTTEIVETTTAEEAAPVVISEKTVGMPPAVGIACGVVSIGAVICYFIFRKKPEKLDVSK